ncbi:MAG: electron transporter, partial [Chloroflexi bacterium]
MRNRTLIVAVAVIAFTVIAPLAWWLVSPLWINRSVDEAFPFELPAQE